MLYFQQVPEVGVSNILFIEVEIHRKRFQFIPPDFHLLIVLIEQQNAKQSVLSHHFTARVGNAL